MTLTTVIGILLIGGAITFPLAQKIADIRRARHDMRTTWNKRSAYRNNNKEPTP